MINFKHLKKALGMSNTEVNSVRLSLGIQDSDGHDTAALLGSIIYNWMSKSDYNDSHCLTVLQYFKDNILELGEKLSRDKKTVSGPLNVIMIQDNTFVTSEWDCNPLDLVKCRGVDKAEMPMPVTFYGLALVAAYLRTLSKLDCLRSGEEDSESAGTTRPS